MSFFSEKNNVNLDQVKSQLASKAKQTDLEIERARITNLTTLPAGSTTGDAELIDGRVGADGITYGNIGSAVRSQISAVNTEVFDYETTQQDISTWQTGYVTQDGTATKVNTTGFEGYEYGTADVTPGQVLKLTFYEVNGYSILFTNGNTFVSKTHLISSNFAQITDLEVTVPAGVNKIIVNSVKNKSRSIFADVTSKISKILSIEQEINTGVRGQLTKINNDLNLLKRDTDISTWAVGLVSNSGTNMQVLVSGYESYYYGVADVIEEEKLKLNFYAKGYQYIIYFAKDNAFISKTLLHESTDPNVQYTDYEVTVPAGVNKIYINSDSSKVNSIIASRVPDINNEIADLNSRVSEFAEGHNNEVYLWGDSLTDGSGSTSGNDYPSKLQTLLGSSYVVKNYGLAGEGCRKIAARRGAVPYYVEPFTIPASGSVSGVVVKDWEGTTVSNLFMRGGQFDATWFSLSKFAINPVSINGVLGNLKQTASGASSYTFERLDTGSAITLTRPTLMSTYGNRLSPNHVDVYWMGTNDSISPNNYAFMIQYIKYMVGRNECNDRYIVIGLTAKSYDSTIESDNDKIRAEFGRNFLDVRKYLMSYGLQDAGLTPTTDDTNAIASGSVPPSLMKTDLVHFNDSGYNIIANQVYKKGQELGYW
jgi:lysophospholipase L1-like esterase